MPDMYEEYLQTYKTYQATYGSKVAVFMMVGIFYELYDTRDPTTGQGNTTMMELTDMLGLKVSIKKGEGPKGHDGLVAGVPDYTVHKWTGRLTQLGWTVVLIEQVKSPAGKVTKREVKRVLTPGSHVEAAGSGDLYMTFLSIEKLSGEPPWLALVSIDLTTGYLRTFETQAQGTEEAWTSNEAVQFMELYPPKEVLWSVDGPPAFCEALQDTKLKHLVGCTNQTVFHRRSVLQGAWLKPSFRETYLREHCQIKNLLPTHAALHLQPQSRTETALLSLLFSLEELWPSLQLGSLLCFPWVPGTTMVLGENALVQLHMILPDSRADQNQSDVLSLLDKCATAMGKRGIRERLLKPSAVAADIISRLDAVELWTKKDPTYREGITRRLRTITDLHRLYRKLQQGTLGSTDLVAFDTSMKAAELIVRSEGSGESYGSLDKILELRRQVFSVFSCEKAYEGSEDQSLFLTGIDSSLDTLESQIQAQHEKLKGWITDRAKSANVTADSFRAEFKDKSLQVKGPRAAIQLLKANKKLPEGTTAVLNKTSSYLESSELDQIFIVISRLRESLARQQSIVAVEKGSALASELLTKWHSVCDWITACDVNLCLAKVALDLGYVRPEIVDAAATATVGSVEITGLRHPLLEAQDRKIPYVQHNVSIGSGSQGWLLYGLNASGKSSLMRATGLAVLLAQGGAFVPATAMRLAPFASLHTRIVNTDNLWMGLSSFAVEMSEMRDIFREAGPRSLVLGDELCSGTETTSATALVAAGLRGLLKRGARFLFATHLHGLSQIQEVAQDPDLKIWHLHVEYDMAKDKLVYHRTLRPGSGSSLYGLEVARAMRIPGDILEDALRFRKRLTGESEISEMGGSAWNSKVVRRECEKCGIRETGDLEVHHIQPRAVATVAGRLRDGSSVHSQSNLIVLCQTCHDDVHGGQSTAEPLVQTSDGYERSVRTERSQSPELNERSSVTGKASKWSEEELQTIASVCRRYPALSLPGLSKYLLNQHEISISAAILKRYR